MQMFKSLPEITRFVKELWYLTSVSTSRGLTTGNISTPPNGSVYEEEIYILLDKYSLKNGYNPAFKVGCFVLIIQISLVQCNVKHFWFKTELC